MLKLLQSPTMFEPWLNQTKIDLSKKKVKLISRETELLSLIKDANYELFEVRNAINSIDCQNDFAQMVHSINIRRRNNG